MSRGGGLLDVECCAAVEKEVDKVLIRMEAVKNKTDSSLDDLIVQLEQAQQELRENPGDEHTRRMILEVYCKKVQDIISAISNQHKDLHASVSKVGKTIDKNFQSDYSAIASDMNDMEKLELLNEVICEHFLRQGRLDVAESLINESGLVLKEEVKAPFHDMAAIVKDLNTQDLTSAFQWVDIHRDELNHIESDLEFTLHKMHFLQLLTADDLESRKNALSYSRILQAFSPRHIADIQKLMGCFLYHGRGLQNSPYSELISRSSWEKLIEQFSKDACTLMGLPQNSPLSICVEAGTKAMAPLLHISNVMLQRHNQPIWGAKDELPVEIDLGEENWFHSIFACPILRQHTSQSNPPMRLKCGHVVSKDALQKLSTGIKLKCPYCPVEQGIREAKQLHL